MQTFNSTDRYSGQYVVRKSTFPSDLFNCFNNMFLLLYNYKHLLKYTFIIIIRKSLHLLTIRRGGIEN